LNVVGLLLAAGSATRFGSDKLQHLLPHGVPIAVQSLRHLRKEIEEILVVVRPGGEKLFEKEQCKVVVCANADEGMGASLACAARAAGEAGGYLVALADMPFIRASSIAAVRDALAAGAPIAAPYFRGHRGHPVGFSGQHYAALISASGDEGARALLARHAKAIVKIPVGDPGVVRDVDKPEDLAPPLAV
jgi:molybdenum cofactor cytidylyltransferase